MRKRDIDSLQKRVHRHARENCANHTGDNGCLLTQHGQCVLSFGTDRVEGNVCPYFLQSVLGGDPALADEYLDHFPDGHPLKPDETELPDKCERCYQRYKKASNRQKYCERCKDEVKREQAADRMKKQRRRESTKHLRE